MIELRNRTRMAIWLAAALVCYGIAWSVGNDSPQMQVVAYKSGHVTMLAWVGYWISRQALGRVHEDTSSQRVIARAILMAGVIIAGSLGL